MQLMSGPVSSAAQLPAVSAVKEQSKTQQSESAVQSRPWKPAIDQYVPEEKQSPTGHYWPGKDEDGQPRIYFDDPEQGRGADGTEREATDSRAAEICRGSTDKVDREIEALKKEKEELKRRIDGETDAAKVKELEKELAQVERELRQKDNDTYRRQHTTFS